MDRQCNDTNRKLVSQQHPHRPIGGALLVLMALAAGCAAIASDGLPQRVWGQPTCAVPVNERRHKDELRQVSIDDESAATAYNQLVSDHADRLEDCRRDTWPQQQAIWLRLYPHDAQPGVLADVLDRVVNRGYNQVYIEVFYEGRVMLPVADNPTVWRSVLEEAVAAGEVDEEYDLWAEAVRQGQARGLDVHGWMFALNFGWAYGELSDRQDVLAVNGEGETSISNAEWDADEVSDGRAFYSDPSELEHLFVDPYNDTARADLVTAVDALLERDPDGMLFDYIRYPTVYLQDTLITEPQQLWIYSPASRQALLEGLESDRERSLMETYIDSGTVTEDDVRDSLADRPDEVLSVEMQHFSVEQQGWADDLTSAELELYQHYFWELATDHAYRGVLEFADEVARPVDERDLAVSTVFFPQGNQSEEGGFDARMQPWDRFAPQFERHPMSYAVCDDGSCVAEQIQEVVNQSPESRVCPILAGTWGQDFGGHLALEDQMSVLQSALPNLDCVSHFVYAWMEPDSDRDRKAGIGVGEARP
ncbi:MAG: hypothetical protein AAF268_00085 [Cyanobacteria bacterium P01_A01_bin.3]